MKRRVTVGAVIICAVVLLLVIYSFSHSEDTSGLKNVIEYEQAGEFSKALEAVNRLLDEDPENPEYLWRKGFYLAETGKTEQGAVCYVRSLKKKYSTSVAFCAAELLAELGQYSDAAPYIFRVAQENPRYLPGLTLAIETKLALWQLEPAEKLINLIHAAGSDTGLLKDELDRRKPVFENGDLESCGTFRHFAYFKNGTVITGLEDQGEERVFSSMDEEELGRVLGSIKGVFDNYSVEIQAVAAAGSLPEDIMFAELLSALTGAELIDPGKEGIRGKNVAVCAVSYMPGDETRMILDRLAQQGACLYICTAGVTRSALRSTQVPVDVAGISGTVMVDAGSLNRESILNAARAQMQENISSQLSMYTGEFASVRIRVPRKEPE